MDAIKNMNLSEAVKRRRMNKWMNHFSYEKCLSNEQGREIAERFGLHNLFWDWVLPRTRDGFYRFKGSVMAAVVRSWAFAPLADLIWMESASPDLAECTKFAQGVKSVLPEIMLAYNLSPSFNWDASGMTDQQMVDFIPRIARLGYCWQFIARAGFHADALVIDTFAKDYAQWAYVERIQRQERNNGVDTLAYKKWSVLLIMVDILRPFKVVENFQSYTICTQDIAMINQFMFVCFVFVGVTEEQFKETWTRPGATDMGGSGEVVAKARM
ncbi:Isocitrate lyase [Dillenia turbinata]|uniref:Isocitrate lyase n=1 Tax=Dillenia turbinata TaxID=194707 RepID=A0AAN8Z325_9MAGN